MIDRKIFTADGREWFEPSPEELYQVKEEVHSLEEPELCRRCFCSIHDEALVTLERRRTWTQLTPISGGFGEWSDWKKVAHRHVYQCDDHEIPF